MGSDYGHGGIYEICRAALAEPPASLAGPQWLPIETAPRDGTKVIIYVSDRENVQAARWRESVYAWLHADDDDDYVLGEITHWLPLPPAPQDGK